ncbi:MAG: permease [Actinomycetota bacterium]
MLAVIAVAVVGLVLGSRLLGLAEQPIAQTFTIVFTAIVVEAIPFVLLGATVSAIIEVYVSDRTFQRVAGLPVPLQLPLAAMGGFAFPVCECGSVPVARRLIGRGMHPSAGVAFMLASPIFNPIVPRLDMGGLLHPRRRRPDGARSCRSRPRAGAGDGMGAGGRGGQGPAPAAPR